MAISKKPLMYFAQSMYRYFFIFAIHVLRKAWIYYIFSFAYFFNVKFHHETFFVLLLVCVASKLDINLQCRKICGIHSPPSLPLKLYTLLPPPTLAIHLQSQNALNLKFPLCNYNAPFFIAGGHSKISVSSVLDSAPKKKRQKGLKPDSRAADRHEYNRSISGEKS